jgi:hypothetical protein
MQSHLRRPLTGASLLLFTTIATASPVVLDTEQKAAAGVATAFWTSDNAPRHLNALIDNDIRHDTHTLLRRVDAVTTPAALMSTPGGVTIACGVSGNILVRMADEQPRVLRVNWRNCVEDEFGRPRTRSGPMAITLPADTFRPQNLLALRFGNDANEYLDHTHSEEPDRTVDATWAYNVVLRGDISMTRFFDVGNWIGTSSYVMNGYLEERLSIESPPGTPTHSQAFRVTAGGLHVVRTTNNANGVDEDDTLFERGTVTFSTVTPAPSGTGAYTWRYRDYHVGRITDFNTFTEQRAVNGRIEVDWSDLSTPGCIDGLYAFRTHTPIVTDLNTGSFVSGKLGVNGSVVANFYSAANTPPALPTPVNGMLQNMRVRDVGTFNYDVQSWHVVSFTVANCLP